MSKEFSIHNAELAKIQVKVNKMIGDLIANHGEEAAHAVLLQELGFSLLKHAEPKQKQDSAKICDHSQLGIMSKFVNVVVDFNVEAVTGQHSCKTSEYIERIEFERHENLAEFAPELIEEELNAASAVVAKLLS